MDDFPAGWSWSLLDYPVRRRSRAALHHGTAFIVFTVTCLWGDRTRAQSDISQQEEVRCGGKTWRAFSDTSVDFNHSHSVCQGRRATLATVRQPADRMCFQMAVKESPKVYFWVGLNDKVEEGKYVWMVDNQLELANSPNWITDQPTGGVGQNCGYANREGKLGDAACSGTISFGFVCQRAEVTSPPATTPTTTPPTTTPSTTTPQTTTPQSTTPTPTPPAATILPNPTKILTTNAIVNGHLTEKATTSSPDYDTIYPPANASSSKTNDGKASTPPHRSRAMLSTTKNDYDQVSSLSSSNSLTENLKRPLLTISVTVPSEISDSPTESSSSSSGSGTIAAAVASLAIAFALLIVAVVLIIRHRKKKQQSSAAYSVPVSLKTSKTTLSINPGELQTEEGDYNYAIDSIRRRSSSKSNADQARNSLCYDNLLYGGKDVYDIYALPYQPPAQTEEEIYKQLSATTYQHIPRDHIEIGTHLGAGHFGFVFTGLWKKNDGSTVQAAIKTLKDGSSHSDRVRFLQEATTAGQFKHRNVIELYGVVTVGKPVLLVLELMTTDLKTLLDQLSSSNPPRNVGNLFLGMANDIAQGMAYLSSKGFVHRDLAARNVMINDDNVCKIGDFGLSRDLAEENYYVSQGGKIPVKWTAPEALNMRQFSTASDVWSYGVVLYEIFDFGKKPYMLLANKDVLSEVEAGYRLPQPDACPTEIYHIMLRCWSIDKHQRPTFVQILQELQAFSAA